MTFFLNKKIYLIAEIANSHEGNIDLAKKLVNEVSKSGTNIIKFQIFKATELLESDHEQYSIFKKLQFSQKEWINLIRFSKKKKLKIFTDVFGIQSAKLALKLNVDGLKIHSTDITNPTLLRFLSKIKKPILLSTAGVFPNEIDVALAILQKSSKEIVLMHGFQGYPTKINDLNLHRMQELRNRYNLPVGLMDHVSGNSEMAKIIPLLGIAMGATVIEKHLTLNRSEKRTDYFSSLNPNEFKELASLIQKTQKSMGYSKFIFSKNEIKYRLHHKKNCVAKKFIKKGAILDLKNFDFKRTKQKQNSLPYFKFEGQKIQKSLKKGAILTNSFINKKTIAAVIACRADSNRLFAKPMQNLGNKIILEHLIEQVKTSKFIDDVVLAISEKPGNEIFVQFALQNNIKYVIGDDRDVLKRLIDGAKYVNADIIFRVTSENPFIFWEGIDDLIINHINKNYDFSYYAKLPIGSSFEVINLESLEQSHKLGHKKHRSELCSLYIHEHQKKFKINRMQPPKVLQKPSIRLTVDTPEDIIATRKIYDFLAKEPKPLKLNKIITVLQKNPDITKINSSIPLGLTRIWE